MRQLQSKTVLILGFGEMGHAMQALLGGRHTLYTWDKYPSADMNNAVLEDVVIQADFIIFCLPVKPHRVVAEMIAPLLRPGCICISIAKGLDEEGRTAAQIFASVFDPSSIDYAFLYGPMISEELRSGRCGFAQLACSRPEIGADVQYLFSGSFLMISLSSDLAGISWSVILKNVYAIVFGMSDELQLGDNMRGFLMMASLSELDAIVRLMGGNAGTCYDLAGLGDLVTTATSKDSHHHELGRRLARGETENISGEGIHTLLMVEQYEVFSWREFPLFSLIKQLVIQPGSARQQIVEFARKAMI